MMEKLISVLGLWKAHSSMGVVTALVLIGTALITHALGMDDSVQKGLIAAGIVSLILYQGWLFVSFERHRKEEVKAREEERAANERREDEKVQAKTRAFDAVTQQIANAIAQESHRQHLLQQLWDTALKNKHLLHNAHSSLHHHSFEHWRQRIQEALAKGTDIELALYWPGGGDDEGWKRLISNIYAVVKARDPNDPIAPRVLWRCFFSRGIVP